MKTIIIFGLVIVNHLLITLLRAYLREERLKKYYFVDPDLLGFNAGIERRILKPGTFACTFFLTLIEGALLI